MRSITYAGLCIVPRNQDENTHKLAVPHKPAGLKNIDVFAHGFEKYRRVVHIILKMATWGPTNAPIFPLPEAEVQLLAVLQRRTVET